MDNLCHSLVGMALSRAGLHKRTALATSTLVIANNLPDIDVGVFATNTLAMSFRRGWTHGVLAQLTLPLALDRRDARLRSLPEKIRARPAGRALADPAALVPRRAVARVHGLHQQLRRAALDAVLRTWFYGDALYIIDPWLYLMLGPGLVARQDGARERRESEWRWPRSTWW